MREQWKENTSNSRAPGGLRESIVAEVFEPGCRPIRSTCSGVESRRIKPRLLESQTAMRRSGVDQAQSNQVQAIRI